MIGRKVVQRKLKNIPHVIEINIASARDLPSVYKPTAYVIVNSIKTNSRRQSCSSSTTSKPTKEATTNPEWNEKIRLTLHGTGVITLNVFSKNLFTADTFLGQAVINLNDYNGMYNGKEFELTLPLKDKAFPVFDDIGAQLTTREVPDSKGTIRLKIKIPSIYGNICGWFWEIKSSFFGAITGEKMWVVLNDGVLYCYDSPFEFQKLHQFLCSNIVEIEEVVYDKLEIVMDGLTIKVHHGGNDVKYIWAWGDDGKVS
jgi:C2 domain